MKNKKSFWVTLAMILIFGLIFAGCGDDGTASSPPGYSSSGGVGSFTVTDIPSEYNVHYIAVSLTYNEVSVSNIGIYSSARKVILNEMADIDVYTLTPYDGKNYMIAYSGDITCKVYVGIYPSASSNKASASARFDSVTFKNGGAKVSWNDKAEY